MFFLILILFLSFFIYKKRIYYSYTRYTPPKNEKSNLIKTVGIITEKSHHNNIQLFGYTTYGDLLPLNRLKIEYIVNDITYTKIVAIYGSSFFLMPGSDINLYYDAEHPEHSYLDITLKELMKRDIFSIVISILFIIIVVVIIMFFTKG